MNEYDIFVQAASKQGSELDVYLSQVCADEPELRRRIGVLLQAHNKSSGFLDDLPRNSEPHPPTGDIVGATIGKYKLLEQIGEGGFGVVYMAEQHTPIRRRVAVKVIKLGMDTKQVVARFDAERQAMAMMDHPNIASVFDAGATDVGRPYFAMELVRGAAITDFCDIEKLDTQQRLKLFVDVCRAIQHAHVKGVIHRDIKPSNVLVTTSDGLLQPKVIDFGIAKATEEPLTDKTVFTQFRQMIGTPAYMSPEQALLNTVDVDTRTDVYSLGVMLYELLTSKTPLDVEKLKGSGSDELLRQIREDDAPSLRAKLSTLNAADRVAIADNRSTKSADLCKLVEGELNWIVAKALAKDRTRRYQTAGAFADDVVRVLRNEPVTAGPPSTSYRVAKFVRRNRGLVSALAVTTAALAIGFCLAVFGFLQAREQAELAVAASEKATAQAVRSKKIFELFREILVSADPERGRGPDFTVRQMLEEFRIELPNKLDGELPDVEAEIHNVIGHTYERLHLAYDADHHLRQVVKLRSKHFGEDHLAVADAYMDFAHNAFGLCQESKAVEGASRAIGIYNRLGTSAPKAMQAFHDNAKCLVELKQEVRQKTSEFKHHELPPKIDRLLDKGEQLTGTLWASFFYLYLDLGDYRAAAELCRLGDERFQAKHPAEIQAGRACRNAMLAVIYRAHGESGRAEELYASLRADTADSSGWFENNPWMLLLAATTYLHDPTSSADEIERAKTLAAEFVRQIKKRGAIMSAISVSTYQALALAQAKLGDVEAAISTLKETLVAGPVGMLFLRGQIESELAGYLIDVQRPEEARKVLDEAVAWRKAKLPTFYLQNSVAELNLARHLLRYPKLGSKEEVLRLLTSAHRRVEGLPADDYYRREIESTLKQLGSSENEN